jgi:uracil-xanthine permease
VALWTVHGDGRRLSAGEAVRSDERLSWPLTAGVGGQHFAAMFGATVLVPRLTGLPVATTLLFSGVGTLLFLLLTRNRVPSYVGSSYAFVAPLVAARDQGLAAQLGGVLLAGLLLVVVGVAVKALGVRLLDSLMPPVVTGAVVVLVALNLTPALARGASGQPLVAGVTVAVIVVCAVLSRGLAARLSVLAGLVAGWAVAAASGRLAAAALDRVRAAAWVGVPALHAPQLRPSVMLLVLPAVLVLVAQTAAQVKAVAAVTGRDLDGSIGDALIASGLAGAVSGAAGGAATGTLPENIGVMAASRIYSTAAYVVAALLAVALSFCPKVDAVLGTVPAGVVDGAGLVLLGLVALVGVRIWLDNGIDLTDPLNLVVAAIAVAAGVGGLTISFGSLHFPGIVVGSIVIVLGHPVLRTLRGARAR